METNDNDTSRVHGTRGGSEPTTVRYTREQLHLLAAIGSRRGHVDRSETLREAIEEYIDRHIREEVAA